MHLIVLKFCSEVRQTIIINSFHPTYLCFLGSIRSREWVTELQVRNKAWFGLRESFSALSKSWTCIKAVVMFGKDYMDSIEGSGSVPADIEQALPVGSNTIGPDYI